MAKTYRFGLFGHPVKHSLSPVMHAASFRALGLQAEYVCFDVTPEALAAELEARRREGFDGLNLTIPHKEAALPLMARLDGSATLFGAVNTVRFEPGGSAGFNTDAAGFLEDLARSRGVSPAGRRVLILGCGGAGRALAIACAREGAARLALANRTASKAERVAQDIRRLLPGSPSEIEVLTHETGAWARACREAELVVQCTSAGLHAEDAPVLPAEAFRPGQLVYDIVYTARVTPTMRSARAAGADALNGAGMLVYQGAAAFEIWTGLAADAAAMRQALEARIYGA